MCDSIVYQSQSHSYFTTGGLPPISSSWWQAPWDSWQEFFFQLDTCGHNPCITPSLTRGWVCRLQFPLNLANAVILRSESDGTHDHILLTQIRDPPPTWRARSPYLYPPGTGWPSYTPMHWDPFSSPPTTRRAVVEVFDPASTRIVYQPCDMIIYSWKRFFHYCDIFPLLNGSIREHLKEEITVFCCYVFL
jgi:hypothetical protein